MNEDEVPPQLVPCSGHCPPQQRGANVRKRLAEHPGQEPAALDGASSDVENAVLLSELHGTVDPHDLRSYRQIARWIADGRIAPRLPPNWKQRTLARVDALLGANRDLSVVPLE